MPSPLGETGRTGKQGISSNAQQAMSDALSFTLSLEQRRDYEFVVKFGRPEAADLLLDAAPPLGRGSGPDAEQLVAAAVANCLSASLLFCLRKFKQGTGAMRATVQGQLVRNPAGRLRIGRMDVDIYLDQKADAIRHIERCLAQFEDFCVVTESVRHGIPVGVRVMDAGGVQLFATGLAAPMASSALALGEAP